MRIKVHQVISGPWEDEDSDEYFNLCLVEYGGELIHDEIWFESFDEAYGMVVHFTKSIDPIEINIPLPFVRN